MTTKPTILYIEDDAANRNLVDRILTVSGYEVITAATGLRGIDLARSNDPDLILTDINLPDLKGYEIATVLRLEERFLQTPIVALTGIHYSTQREVALAAGINGYLVKPLNTTTLREQIQYYLDGGQDSLDAKRLSEGQARYTREVIRHLERRIREMGELNAELMRLDRMKQTFIQITAHELRTPLTLVYGYVRLLEDFPSLQTVFRQDETVKTLIDGLVESIERMHGVVNEILTISRLMTQDIELNIAQIDLGLLIFRVLKGFTEALQERKMRVKFEQSQFPQSIRADADLLKLAVTNLIGNAIKYTPDGGTVSVVGSVSDGQVKVVVRDTGVGIDIEEQKHIFDQFHTVDDAELHSTSKTAFGGGGLGLGLPIARGIIEAHGGQILVESAGRDIDTLPGSTFTVALPLFSSRSTMSPIGN